MMVARAGVIARTRQRLSRTSARMELRRVPHREGCTKRLGAAVALTLRLDPRGSGRMYMDSRLFPIAALALVFSPATALATWSNDGLPVAWAAEQQIYPVVTTDGAGGAIIAWQDGRAG